MNLTDEPAYAGGNFVARLCLAGLPVQQMLPGVSSYYIPSAYGQFPEIMCWFDRVSSSRTQQGRQILAQAHLPGNVVPFFTKLPFIYRKEEIVVPKQMAIKSTSK